MLETSGYKIAFEANISNVTWHFVWKESQAMKGVRNQLLKSYPGYVTGDLINMKFKLLILCFENSLYCLLIRAIKNAKPVKDCEKNPSIIYNFGILW